MRSAAFPDRMTRGAGLVVMSQLGIANDLGVGGFDDDGCDEREQGAPAAVWQSSRVAMMPPLRKPNPLSCSGHGINVAAGPQPKQVLPP